MRKKDLVHFYLVIKRIFTFSMNLKWLLQNNVIFSLIKGMLTKDDFNIYKYCHKMPKEGFILNIQVNSDQTFVLLGF